MHDYARSFNREINGKSITVDDIKYFAKIEDQRTLRNVRSYKNRKGANIMVYLLIFIFQRN